MKNKRIFSIISILLLVTLLSVTLVGCLKIFMTPNNIKSRLEKNGATYSYLKTTPMTVDGQNNYKIGDIILASVPKYNSTYMVYIIFCNNNEAADWVENCCKAYAKKDEAYFEWNTYRYENILMYGQYQALAVVRGY